MKLLAPISLILLLTTAIGCSGVAQPVTDTPSVTLASSPATAPTPLPTSRPFPTPTPSPSPTPTPTPTVVPDPLTAIADSPDNQVLREVLASAMDAMEELQSVHFSIEAEVSMDTEGLIATIPFRFEGDYLAPDRLQGKVAISLGFIALEMEMINIGTKAYITDPQTGLWKETDGNALGTVNPSEFTGLSKTTESLELTMQDEETLDNGTRVMHLVGLSPALSDGEGSASDLKTNIYIGLDDSLVHKVMMEGAIPLDPEALAGIIPGIPIPLGGSDGTATITMTVTFSAFNEPLEIEAPTP